ncbi:hypothetical protein RUE5091_02598 [Ruegeria denitrificans]|uniref:Uncharacterized protein n=1 Tax=Ruegeria denitrificans TaxID=1715692 RepID=A0A0P1IIL1_9RHOB|nr:hypothetical protein RUE5091_02598 [Ruegeria denitrificans]
MDTGQRLFQDIRHEFHDNSIYALKLISPDPNNGDWVSELILDIDHIEDWIRRDNGRFSFSLCQVNLCFEGVSDLTVSFSFPKLTITPLPIDRITRSREPVRVHGMDYFEFVWTKALNDRRGGRICFHATGYRIERVGKPVTCEEQYLPKHLRLPS